MARICDICGEKATMIANISTDTGTRQVELCNKHLESWHKTKENDNKLCVVNNDLIKAQQKMQPLQEAVWKREWELGKIWLKSFGL